MFSTSTVFSWNGANNPRNFASDLEYYFDALPLSGEISSTTFAWPGYHWPSNKQSINNRWSAVSGNQVGKYLGLFELKKLKESELLKLSPAEKFDILRSRYDYPLVNKARRLSRENASDWNGICHGLAAASSNHPEPKVKTAISSDGIKVSFFASDLKALLAFTYAENSNVGVSQVGKRCFFSKNTPIVWRHNSCTDMNAGSFHILITNFLGLRDQSIIADLDRYKEVWNHPISSFKTQMISRESTRVRVRTEINYPDIINPQFGPLLGTSFDYKRTKIYEYTLYLREDGSISGGFWHTRDRPDFMWIQNKLDLDPLLEDLLD